MKQCFDGNSAVAHVAYAVNEVACIYPITPSSSMAELCDEWSAGGRENIYGKRMKVVEMQSEGGASGALHGALSGGALATTFTSSQGLLLMIPNMYKIAGELLPSVINVSARAIASHALSIFGDHQDVMAVRSTGFAMLCSGSVQECMDGALISEIATLSSSVPFVHFFDGFRTSHEIQKIDVISYDDIKRAIDPQYATEFKALALNPKNPHQQGTAQNPDIYFQNRESCNQFYDNVYGEVKKAMDMVFEITGRRYQPFEYYGDKNAESVFVCMGSACETIKETISKLCASGKKVGVVCVKLFRPFNVRGFCEAIPKSATKICVLDRTKEAGSVFEPLCSDVISALNEAKRQALVVGGRYGLGGKEFTPECVIACLENLESAEPKNHFTVGINDDVTFHSLSVASEVAYAEDGLAVRFYGLGGDGTISANKNAIKIIGDNTNKYVQGYFEYDSKKSGSLTISHLRISDAPIQSEYLTRKVNFVCISNYSFVSRGGILDCLNNNGVVLLCCPLTKSEIEQNLPVSFASALKQKNAKLYIINANQLASEHDMGGKINTIMTTAFFKLSGALDFEFAKEKMKEAIKKSYGKKGEEVVAKNNALVDLTEGAIQEIDVLQIKGKEVEGKSKCSEYYEGYIAPIIAGKGGDLPVSAFAPDGVVPTGTSQFEKRGIASRCPEYIPKNCIECGRCVASCPHSALSTVLVSEENLANMPESFETRQSLGQPGLAYRIQVSPLDCTGCGVCSRVCPAKNKALEMKQIGDVLQREKENFAYSKSLPCASSIFAPNTIKGLQFKRSYFEFSGACAGCGETPYIKMLTQLFGDNLIIANATGCSSIYGGSAPTCPFSKDELGHGPAWANSLFEDNAEFGLGIKIAREINKESNNVWIVGGDGWAYDIGYGGLDHVLCSNENVNILVLDTEVYSNTGGQASKSTQKGGVAKFASDGKRTKKKDLFFSAMATENCYVASISLGYDGNQAVKAFKEAVEFDGPSIIIAYAPCINHGIDMENSNEEMKKAVLAGYFTLARYNPKAEKKLFIDSAEPTLEFSEFLSGENRFRSLKKFAPDEAEKLFKECQADATNRRERLKKFL